MEINPTILLSSATDQPPVILRIPHSQGIRITQADEIIRVEASSNYCRIFFLTGKPMLVAKVLRWFEKRLPPKMFTRVHRSHLVNNCCIEAVTSGKYTMILLRNGEKVMMSRRKKSLLRTG